MLLKVNLFKCVAWLVVMMSFSAHAMSARAPEHHIVVLGGIQRIIIERVRQEITKTPNNEFMVNNSCGKYEILINIDEVIIGAYSDRRVVARGVLSEWCEAELKFNPETNIFHMVKRKGGYYVENHIPLYEMGNKELAALPEWAEFLGDASLIQRIDFSLNQRDIYIESTGVSKLPKEWVDERKGVFIYKVGIPYESIKSFLIKQGEFK